MNIEKISSDFSSNGQTATELWRGEIDGKHFDVLLDSCAAPKWSGDDLSQDDCMEVMRELSEKSEL